MDRRAFVGGLTVGAGLGIASSGAGCGSALFGGAPRLSAEPGEVERFCARFDDGLPRIQRRAPVTGALTPEMLERSSEGKRFAKEADPVARRALRSLHVAGAYGDLSAGGRADPRVQERMASFAPEMDTSVVELKTMMAQVPEAERREIARALRDGAPAMQIAEAIDEEARALDVSMRSRTKLRAAARHVTFRLSRQPPSLFIDEYVDKVERVAANRGIDLLAQTEVAARATERLFWKEQRNAQNQTQRETGEGPRALVRPPPDTSGWERPPGQSPEHEGTRGSGLVTSGGWMLGIGAVVFGIGGALLAGEEVLVGLVLMTAGAIGVVVGLVLLIIGAIIKANSD